MSETKPKPTGWHVESCNGYSYGVIKAFTIGGWEPFAVTQPPDRPEPKIWWRKQKDIPDAR